MQMSQFRKKIPLSRAVVWIFLSTVIVSGSATMGSLYYQHLCHQHSKDDAYTITAITQSGSNKEVLTTSYLAQLMGLSTENPMNLFVFDSEEARKKLIESPLIEEAAITKVRPNTLYLDCKLRHPIAFCSEWPNLAIDEKGLPIPFTPFFTPKHLPILHTGKLDDPEWNVPFTQRGILLAIKLIKRFAEDPEFSLTRLKKIDVSFSFADNYGHREILLEIEEHVDDGKKLHIFPRELRLPSKGTDEQLSNYLLLREFLNESIDDIQPEQSVYEHPILTIDMRIENLAFLSED
jgi:hypothetical protein